MVAVAKKPEAVTGKPLQRGERLELLLRVINGGKLNAADALRYEATLTRAFDAMRTVIRQAHAPSGSRLSKHELAFSMEKIVEDALRDLGEDPC